jgi:hypothetical protein
VFGKSRLRVVVDSPGQGDQLGRELPGGELHPGLEFSLSAAGRLEFFHPEQ